MPLDFSVIGAENERQEWSWTSDTALLYAIGVGCGLGDPLQELQFTTENSTGVDQQVLPTFGVIVARWRGQRNFGDVDRSKLVHGEQYVELHRPIPVEGTVSVSSTVTGMFDKGSGALVRTENVATDVATGEPLVTARSGSFIRGEGGFGGERGDDEPWERPDRDPDHRVVLHTRPEQTLLYRLSGDRNPLHSDPAFAAMGGFDRPILHGLCTYGLTGRALLGSLCGWQPERFRSMSGRFSKPVMPGESLTVSIWVDDDTTARFQTTKEDGTVVLDHGRVRTAGAAG